LNRIKIAFDILEIQLKKTTSYKEHPEGCREWLLRKFSDGVKTTGSI
jgi:hypothetical protein